MAIDYDLVVIGSTAEGLYAAATAAHLQARVALVTQNDTGYLDNHRIINHSVTEIGRWNYQSAQNPFATQSEVLSTPISFSEAINWGKGVNSNLIAENSLTTLAALGVDVIVGKGEFVRLPKLALNVGKRKLRSRSFLLAIGSNFIVEPIDGSSDINCLTVSDLWNLDLSALPDNLTIVGNDPISLELAQNLARFGKKITLVVKQRILFQEDLDIAMLIQAQLEVEGIEIITAPQISQVKEIDHKKWLQAGDRAIETDEIIFTNYRQPNIEGLNLAGVNVKYDFNHVQVNHQLQTTNRNIYACGDLIGGYSLPNIAQYEVNLILKNTLFIPWYKADYSYIPWAVLTQPNLARVGLTEAQAKQQYGKDIYIVKQHFKSVTQAQILGATTGLCKLLVSKNGRILGCSLVCDRAAELIGTVALLMKQKIKLDSNPMKGLTSIDFPYINPSFAEIWQQVAVNFYRQKLQRNPKLLNRLETWFNLRRDWHK
jgi:pyruvate/2-oxoglutarate dehydrogenase complex dihydrolipoamide dehydrogenase (E3) component